MKKQDHESKLGLLNLGELYQGQYDTFLMKNTYIYKVNTTLGEYFH